MEMKKLTPLQRVSPLSRRANIRRHKNQPFMTCKSSFFCKMKSFFNCQGALLAILVLFA